MLYLLSVQVTKIRWEELEEEEQAVLERCVERGAGRFNGRDVATLLGKYVRA